VPDLPKLDDALIEYGKLIDLKDDARHVPEAVRDIRRRPSQNGNLVLPSREIVHLVAVIADIEQRTRADVERKHEAREWDE
jgi:hypothetical protein